MLTQKNTMRIAASRIPSSTGVSPPQLSRVGLLTLNLETTWAREGRTKGSRGRTEADCCWSKEQTRVTASDDEKPAAGRATVSKLSPSLLPRARARNQKWDPCQATNSPKARRAKRTAKRRVIFGSLGGREVIEFWEG